MIELVVAILMAQPAPASGIRVQDEGVTRGSNVSTINCTGTGVTCSVSGTRATLDVTAGGGGAPTTATYWTSTSDAGLSAEVNLGGLTTGLLLNTVSGGTGTPSAYSGATCTLPNVLTALSASGTATCSQPTNVTGSAASITGTLPLANLTDSGTSGLCLLSGGTGGNPAYTTCPGGGGTPGGSDTHVQFNNAGAFGGSANLVWNNSTGTLSIGGGTPLAGAPLFVSGNINSWLQYAIQNLSAGSGASTDIVAMADTGTDTANYIDLGINSSGYSQAAYNIGGPLDGYLMTNGGSLAVGTQTAGKVLKFHTGGTTTAETRLTLSDGALTFGAGVSIVRNGALPTGYLRNTTTTGVESVSASIPISDGGSGVSSRAANDVVVGTAADTTTTAVLPSCSNGTTDKLLYNSTTHAFSCGADQGGAGSGLSLAQALVATHNAFGGF